jgi:hypothetical protein
MTLKHDLADGILHVEQTTHSATTTEHQHWYYDIAMWRVSSHGREGDVPDRDMTSEAIEWVIHHHLPKVMDAESIAALPARHAYLVDICRPDGAMPKGGSERISIVAADGYIAQMKVLEDNPGFEVFSFGRADQIAAFEASEYGSAPRPF